MRADGHLGGIDLGGTKIQAVVVDEDHSVLGSCAPADADRTVARRRGGGDGRRRCATPPPTRGSRSARSEASASARPGVIEDGQGDERAKPPRLGRHLPAGGEAREARSAATSSIGNDVQVATDGRVPSRRRPAVSTRCSASSGARASAGG